jgi:hypothetical protein
VKDWTAASFLCMDGFTILAKGPFVSFSLYPSMMDEDSS